MKILNILGFLLEIMINLNNFEENIPFEYQGNMEIKFNIKNENNIEDELNL